MFCDLESVGAVLGVKKFDCCLSGVLWKARIVMDCAGLEACRSVAVMAKGRRSMNAIIVSVVSSRSVVICVVGKQMRGEEVTGTRMTFM